MKKILITGAAGFIGFHLAKSLHQRGDFCVGLDHFNEYYDIRLKKTRAGMLEKLGVEVLDLDICQKEAIKLLILQHQITHVVHLAAQAGVRHSISHPQEYISSNINGFFSLLEVLRLFPNIKLTYASSSSVYGLNQKIPFSVEDPTDLPANLYGATKKSNEMMAHSYHHLYGLHVTALRYFTVYGPWGRPDMAYYKFAQKICNDEPIEVYNQGLMKRDFTYIDDIVKGTLAAIDLGAKCEVFNLGNNSPIELLFFIERLEEALGKKAIKEMKPMQQGEVVETFADIQKSKELLGFEPKVSLDEGISTFTSWFKEYYQLSQPSTKRMQCI